MVPHKLRAFFECHAANDEAVSNRIEGLLTCCLAHDFEVLVVGKMKHSLFWGACLFPQDDIIVLHARCKKCGKDIPIYNSDCDGYDRVEEKQHSQILLKPVRCKKCKRNSFLVRIKYEYPNVTELMSDGITEIDNAFTWINVMLLCNVCGTRYNRFVDCETG